MFNRFTTALVLLLVLSPKRTFSNDQSILLPCTEGTGAEKWEKFKNFTARDLDKFVENNAELSKVQTVLYPFAGGDILYPFLLFADLRELILLGLEPIGDGELKLTERGALPISPDLESLLRRSFMKTQDMRKNLSREEVGIFQVIVEQLSLLGVQSLGIEKFDLEKQAFKVKFTYKGLQRRVLYFKQNLCDDCFPSDFLKTVFMAHGTAQATLLKSTSYALHLKNFSKIKNLILQNSNLIVQDDTGICLKDLELMFDVKKFGNYTRPYGEEFKRFMQDGLVAKKSVPGAVPKCFGYGCGIATPVVLVAKKKTSFSDAK